MHYVRLRRNGTVESSRPRPRNTSVMACSVEGCTKPHFAFRLCSAHYTRKRRHGDPGAGRTSQGEPLSWLKAHETYPGDDCLIWPYARARGYGMVTIDGAQRVASNYMCELVHGHAPTAKHECAHSCGNGGLGCVNPNHLRWATRAENHQDMYIHGVRPLGERTKKNKVTTDQVRAIRKAKADGAHVDAIAAEYGLSRAGVYAIVNRTNWAWLD